MNAEDFTNAWEDLVTGKDQDPLVAARMLNGGDGMGGDYMADISRYLYHQGGSALAHDLWVHMADVMCEDEIGVWTMYELAFVIYKMSTVFECPQWILVAGDKIALTPFGMKSVAQEES